MLYQIVHNSLKPFTTGTAESQGTTAPAVIINIKKKKVTKIINNTVLTTTVIIQA